MQRLYARLEGRGDADVSGRTLDWRIREMPIIRGVICDSCHFMICWESNVSKQMAAEAARNKGWTIGKRCLCPDCKPKKKRRVPDD